MLLDTSQATRRASGAAAAVVLAALVLWFGFCFALTRW